MDLDSAAEELYGVPADEFAQHRTRLAAQAKAAGDKALAASIGKLRKPVLAAALVNELVRGEPAELQELTDLGEQMRNAHRNLLGPELRALSEQRQQLLQLLTELVRETAEQSGRTVTETVLAQVRSTFEAAIADEAAEAAVLSGRLTAVLSYTGFGEVDVTDAVAAPVRKRHLRSVPAGPDAPGKADPEAATGDQQETPAKKADSGRAATTGKLSSGPTGTKTAGTKTAAAKRSPAAEKSKAAAGPASSAEQARQRRLQRQQDQVQRAEAEHADAVRLLEQAQNEAAAAGQRHQEATAEVERLRAQLEQAQEQAWGAGQARRSAERARLTAEEEADRTAAALQAARRQLKSLESDREPD